MRKHLLIFTALLCSVMETFSQSTEIKPGTILPQMTTAQRTAVTNPNGMLVFDSDTQSYWYRQSGSWVELPKGGSTANYWQLTGAGGNEIKNTNSGGFWSTNATGLTDASDNVSNPPTAPISGVGTRLMWIPSRSAFRAGTVSNSGGGTGTEWDAANIGLFSTAFGYTSTANGKYSTAMGFRTKASGIYSTAMGLLTTVNGASSTAMGAYSKASAESSTAMGNSTEASGSYSTAMGRSSKASGDYSTAMGNTTKAIGDWSTAIGFETQANGNFSTAMGYSTAASSFSTAMGYNTTASGQASTTMGQNTKAMGDNSTAMGINTTASGDLSTALGVGTLASGFSSNAMGRSTKASGSYSSAMGYETQANGSYSTAMGNFASTNGHEGSLAIGDNSTAAVITNSADNQFITRFAGGYRFYTNSIHTIGASLNAGANSWSMISDSTKKENFIPADGESILKSVSAMRIGTWNYKKQDPASFRHWGVMAQDFYAHFGKDSYGTIGNDTTIATGDFDGVSFAAIKALEARTRELKSENGGLKAEISKLQENNKRIMAEYKQQKNNSEARFAKLENLLSTKQKLASEE